MTNHSTQYDVIINQLQTNARSSTTGNSSFNVMIILRQREDQGIGASFSRMVASCGFAISKGLPYIINNSSWLPNNTKFTDYYEQFWDEEKTQKELDDADQILVHEEIVSVSDLLIEMQPFKIPEKKVVNIHYSSNLSESIYNSKIPKYLQTEIFRLKPELRNKIGEIKTAIKLPERYSAVHIRRGDMVNHMKVFYGRKPNPIKDFIDPIIENMHSNNIFVATDSPNVIDKIKHFYPQLNIYSISDKNPIPHVRQNIDSNAMLYALFDIEVSVQADYWVGTPDYLTGEGSGFSRFIWQYREDLDKNNHSLRWPKID